MYDKIFQRLEQKYILSKKEYENLMKKIEKKLVKDKYYKSTICSIYFDNDNNDLIIKSIEKPKYKNKIRIRSYEIPTLNDDIFIEIKNKYNSTVGKRRIKIKLKDYYNYIENGIYDKNNQIFKEIDYIINYYRLKPKIYIAYDRLSYTLKEDEKFRITFDFNLRSRKDKLNLEYSGHEKKFFKEERIIMEVKTLKSIPLWLTKTLSELKIYPTSFSKYGQIYSNESIKESE